MSLKKEQQKIKEAQQKWEEAGKYISDGGAVVLEKAKQALKQILKGK
jgi:hypothetical protein